MKKIYLAGSCSSEQRTMMQRIAAKLRSENYTVYCPFELKIPDAWSMSQEAWSKKVFDKDIEALNECDVFLMISPGRYGTAGTNWEQGYAFAKGKKIVVMQYTENSTSLMTFCGSNVFFSTNLFDIETDVIDALFEAEILSDYGNKKCRTVLT